MSRVHRIQPFDWRKAVEVAAGTVTGGVVLMILWFALQLAERRMTP